MTGQRSRCTSMWVMIPLWSGYRRIRGCVERSISSRRRERFLLACPTPVVQCSKMDEGVNRNEVDSFHAAARKWWTYQLCSKNRIRHVRVERHTVEVPEGGEGEPEGRWGGLGRTRRSSQRGRLLDGHVGSPGIRESSEAISLIVRLLDRASLEARPVQ